MKYIIDIHGEIEGDYEILGKYEERPHGKWKTFRGMKEDMYCSKCDMDFPNDEKNRSLFNFCPFCGADMREGDGS